MTQSLSERRGLLFGDGPRTPLEREDEEVELADFERPFTLNTDALIAGDADTVAERYSRLQEFKRAMTLNPLWGFMPHQGEYGYKVKNGIQLVGDESRGQVEFLELGPLGVFLAAIVASNRFGKTEINMVDAIIQTIPGAFVPPWLLPYKYLHPENRDVRMRFIGPDKDRWRDRACIPKMRKWIPPACLYGGTFDKAWKQREGTLTFADGSLWDFLTHDMELDAYASVELDSARIDEEPTGEQGERKYEETVRGLVDRAGNVRITLTPVEGIGWLHEELADPETDDPRRDLDAYCVTGSIDHNPHISSKGRERAKKVWAKKPSTYKARAEGSWTHREGLIFPEFVRELEAAPGQEGGGHLRSPRPLKVQGAPSPIDWASGRWQVPVMEAIDPGINEDHPFAYSIAFLNSGLTDVFGLDDVLEVFYAFKAPDLDTNQQAAIVHEARARFGFAPTFTVIDPAAQNRNPETGRKLIQAWRNEGIFPVLGQNSYELTYSEIRIRLRGAVAPGAPADPSTSRYRIWTTLDPLLGDEFANYRWKKPSGRSEDSPAPRPVKRKDDLVDTQRYMCARIPVWRGGGRVIEELAPEVAHPQRELLKRHLIDIRRAARRGGRKGRVGGAW